MTTKEKAIRNEERHAMRPIVGSGNEALWENRMAHTMLTFP
jgi:hypothetical protein